MKTIEDVLNASTDEVLAKTTQILLTYYPKKVFVYEDDFVYAAGESPITLIAHVDTVRDPQIKGDCKKSWRKKDEKPMAIIRERNILSNANGVLGADDRAGVFACLELVRKCKKEKLPMPSIIFANGEESGGLGINVFISTDAFKKHDGGKTKLFVEMDRCNATEWVTYGSTLPREVVDYIESFGFHKGNGSYSDVADMQEEYLIPGVNLSIGYYKQHTDNEVLHVDEMYMTINRVMNMLRDPIDKLYPVKPYVSSYGGYGGSWQDYDYRDYHGYKGQGGSNSASGNGTAQTKKNDAGNGSSSAGKSSSASATSSITSAFPLEKFGKANIDEVIDTIAFGGWCHDCGHPFEDCDCGNVLLKATEKLATEEIEFLCDNYLADGSVLKVLLGVYLSAQEELKREDSLREVVIDVTVEGEEPTGEFKKMLDDYEGKKDDPKDPFHVGEEGAPLLLPETTKEVGETETEGGK